MVRPWVTFFSQTGGEIADLSDELGRYPDLIVTNKRSGTLRTIDSRIVDRVAYASNTPTEAELENILTRFEDPIITLHGWLRIMPPSICENYEIYNGHPGLITTYPELKGKDPQVRAFELNHPEVGAVLHYVTAGVDEGEIIMEERFSAKGLEIGDIFRILKDRSLDMWKRFLTGII
tara:strand:+ start:807 stop:1337 length:531 start_codon:yes stop_codon:yes gene_type:complete